MHPMQFLLLSVSALVFLPSMALAVVGVVPNRLGTIRSAAQLANLCLQGQMHKTEPGPEPLLKDGPCAVYAGRACCTAAVGNRLGSDDEFANAAFRLDHCGQKLSPKCARWFERSRCMYECSPYLGPWLVKVSGYTWRTERVYNLPLCRGECLEWFNACQDDYTCVTNWSHDFQWKSKLVNGTKKVENLCPPGAKCRPFAEVFKNSAHFCESVWDEEYDVVSESMPCLMLRWNSSTPDPNHPLAVQGAHEKLAFLTGPPRLPSATMRPAPSQVVTIAAWCVAALSVAAATY